MKVVNDEVMARWRSRLAALRSNPRASYLARCTMDASYISDTGEYIPRVCIRHVYPAPTVDEYQFPIDATPYRIAALSMFLLTTYRGGPPSGWQPPNWTIVHEEQPNAHLAFLGKAETPEPPAEVFERAREWAAKNADNDGRD